MMTPSTPPRPGLVRAVATAERVLTLVLPREEAAAAAGDLLESEGSRSPARFWLATAGVVVSSTSRQVEGSFLPMAATAGVAWFGYMAISLVLTFALALIVAVQWAIVSIASGHTGLELLTDALALQVPWPPGVWGLVFWMQVVAMWTVAPYYTVRVAARCWEGREVALAAVVATVWAVLAYTVPFVLVRGSWTPMTGLEIPVGTTESWLALPLMALFVVCGGVRQARNRIEVARLKNS